MMPTVRITETLRSTLLRRPLKPSVTRDVDVPGLCLVVTTRRGFWCLIYQPRGTNPATGKRWGGGVRHELCDAMMMPVSEARATALAVKSIVRQGRSPHHEAMASRASIEAARAIVPQTVGETLSLYETAIMGRRQPSEWSRKQSVRYARLACTTMNASSLPLASIDVRAVRLMIETAPGADAQRRHIFGGLSRFISWCRKQGLVETNPCDALDRSERPKPGAARDHVPTLATLRAIWAAAADECAGDLLRFLLLLPLRRNEASGLRWSEVDLDQNRIRIAAHRMKARQPHELPLSPPARAILEARKLTASSELVFPFADGATFTNWTRLLARIRKQVSGSNDFHLHDIRRGFVSHLAGRFDIDALDQCLAHVRGGVAGIYQRSQRWPDRERALNAWADLILGVEANSNVVPLSRKVV
jgi:integrase